MKLHFKWAPGVVIAFITAMLIPAYTLTAPFVSSLGFVGVIATTLITLVTLLTLALISGIKAKRFYDDTDVRSTYNTLKLINLISTVLFAVHIMGTLLQVVLVEELKRFPPHWDFVLNYTDICTHYTMLFPKIIPALTLALFALSTIWPLTTVFFKKKL